MPTTAPSKNKESAVNLTPENANVVRNALESLATHRDAGIATCAQDALLALDGEHVRRAVKKHSTSRDIYALIVHILCSANADISAEDLGRYASALVKAGVKISS